MLRRIITASTACALAFLISGAVLLSNTTAPNPTGRRYSSEPIDTRASSRDIGDQGEAILARDLNQTPNPLHNGICLCPADRTSTPPLCASCVVHTACVQTSHRVPDFVAENRLIEVKNHRNDFYEGDVTAQIDDYLCAALELGVPLWIYTRIGAPIDEEIQQRVQASGGAIVPYLAPPGYQDSGDRVGRSLLVTGGGLLTGVLVLLAGQRFRRRRAYPVLPAQPTRSPARKLADAEQFITAVKERHRQQIDAEDAHPQ